MSSTLQVLPYPKGWLKRFFRLPILLFRLGLSALLNGSPILILTTRGRQSGQPRFAALEYRRHGSKIYVISGWGERPQWYQNLLASPEATVALGNQTYRAHASTVTDSSEKVRALYMFRNRVKLLSNPYLVTVDEALNRPLREMQPVAQRYTVLKLELRTDAPVLPTVEPDLTWVWPLAAAVSISSAWLAARQASRANHA